MTTDDWDTIPEPVEQVIEQHECVHHHVEYRMRTLSNSSTAIHKQCLTCGQSVAGAFKKTFFTQEQLAIMPKYDNDLAGRYFEQGKVGRERARIKGAAQVLALKRAKYAEYLQSPARKYKREQVMERDDHTCQGCGLKATDVHHTTYEHIFDELLFELIAVCRNCHTRIHKEWTPHE